MSGIVRKAGIVVKKKIECETLFLLLDCANPRINTGCLTLSHVSVSHFEVGLTEIKDLRNRKSHKILVDLRLSLKKESSYLFVSLRESLYQLLDMSVLASYSGGDGGECETFFPKVSVPHSHN